MEQPITPHVETGRFWFPSVVAGLLLLFLAAPWSWQHKAHAALHGLCAQTPSHTLYFGGTPLPFDSRMTGIYTGFFTSLVVLIAMGRHRGAKLPSWRVAAVLAAFVASMSIDGFNSLLLDLRYRNLYEPDNRLRLLTGGLTGIALAVVVCYLFALSLWRHPELSTKVIEERDLVRLVGVLVPALGLMLTGAGWLAFPVSLFLVIAAVSVISSLALVAIVLFRCLDSSFDSYRDLGGVASAAVLTAVLIMAMLASGRFLLEYALGIQTLT